MESDDDPSISICTETSEEEEDHERDEEISSVAVVKSTYLCILSLNLALEHIQKMRIAVMILHFAIQHFIASDVRIV